MNKSKLLFLILFLNSVLVVAQSTFPNTEWTYNMQAQKEGWNQNDARKLYKYVADSTKVTSMLIVHKGQIVFQYGDVSQQNYIASCRKSVLSMLYGKYVDNNTIDLSKTLKELKIDDVGGVLPIESKASIQDLISSRSGIYRPASNPGTWVKYIKKRGTVTPGTRWLYNNWDFNVAGHLFEELSGKNIYDEITNQFANPLQFQDWDRERQQKVGNSQRSKYLAYAMWFSTRDLARLGLLMLNNGQWKDQQIISKSWMSEMLKERTTPQEMQESAPVMKRTFDLGYGYMWWLWKNMKDSKFKDAYSALGAYGQNITVLPAMDVVIVFNTKVEYGRANNTKITQELPKKIIETYSPNSKD